VDHKSIRKAVNHPPGNVPRLLLRDNGSAGKQEITAFLIYMQDMQSAPHLCAPLWTPPSPFSHAHRLQYRLPGPATQRNAALRLAEPCWLAPRRLVLKLARSKVVELGFRERVG
jgi:hypothetical protein